MKTPRPYQVEGAQFLAERPRALLLDEMGLGKTLQALNACRLVGARKIQVVCPASVVPAWYEAFEDEGLDADFEACSYETAVKKTKGDWDTLVVDEAHYVKTTRAKRSKVVRAMASIAERAWGMTGTPMPNHQGELYHLLKVFAPEAVADIPNEFAFWNRFCYIARTDWGDKPYGRKNVEELRQRIRPYVLRRTKVQVLTDLPPVTWGEIALKAPGVKPSRAEQARMERALGTVAVGSAPPLDEQLVTMRRLIETMKAKPLAELLRDELTSTVGTDYKVVVFGWFNDALDVVCEELEAFGVCRLSGGATAKQRAAAVKDFQTDNSKRVFVGQILAAGTGITLTAASNLVFLGLDWVPANNAQAAMRVHRIGQTKPVLIRTAHLVGSVDDVVQRTLARKTEDTIALWETEQ